MLKKDTWKPHIFSPVPTTFPWSLFILKNNYIYDHVKKEYLQTPKQNQNKHLLWKQKQKNTQYRWYWWYGKNN